MGVPGLDQARWRVDQARPQVAAAYQADWRECRAPNDYVRNLKHDSPMNGELKHSEGHDRYAYPTIIFRGGPGGDQTVAGGWTVKTTRRVWRPLYRVLRPIPAPTRRRPKPSPAGVC